MNVCILGDGLVSLTLAKTLINNKIKVYIYYETNNKVLSNNRTIGVSSNNLSFLQKEVIKLKKNFSWGINQIEIYNEKNKNEKILSFGDKKEKLFFTLKNKDLYQSLHKSLSREKNFQKIKIKKKSIFFNNIKNKNFDLIINCDLNNEISKKYFFNRIYKSYNSNAYVTIINHKKIDNQKAIQIFTKKGPIAFLPISNSQTSVVFSIKNKNLSLRRKFSDYDFQKLIKEYNKKYNIHSMEKFETFKLKSKNLRKYYTKNILAFGELLHQIHPLSGQGFNMTLRDIKILLDIIKNKKTLGLQIDHSVYSEFEKKTKHLNFLFASGNDFIYEFFNYDNKYIQFIPQKFFSFLNKNKLFNNLAINYANKGLNI